MESVKRTDDIEAGCDPSFDDRWSRVQRVCWVVLSLTLAAGVAGFFGNGPLSTATASVPGAGLEVNYQRLARRETPAVLQVHLNRELLRGGEVRLRLSRELIDHLRIQDIIPQPVSTEPLDDGARFIFRTDPAADGANVVFIQDPSRPGFFDSEVSVEGGPRVRFRQFVYP